MSRPGHRTDICIPDLDHSVDGLALEEWLITVGEHIEADRPVARVKTSGESLIVTSTVAGTVIRNRPHKGEGVAVGESICVIDGGDDIEVDHPRGATTSLLDTERTLVRTALKEFGSYAQATSELLQRHNRDLHTIESKKVGETRKFDERMFQIKRSSIVLTVHCRELGGAPCSPI